MLKVFLSIAFLALTAEAALKCYQCNSAVDPECETGDAEQLKKHIVECPKLADGTYKGNEPSSCRKIVQNVESAPTRIIRECAYTLDNNLDGMRKQGNNFIKLLYYQCENAPDSETPCNGGSSLFASMLALSLCALIALRQ